MTNPDSKPAAGLSANAGTFGAVSPGESLSLRGAAGHAVSRRAQPKTAKAPAVVVPAEIPQVPVARKAADELPGIPDLVRAPLGLLDRAEAVAVDIMELVEDACDQQLDHALIKALVTANGAMQRAARRLAQG